MERFDVVIIGSGIGGLICGAILSREGYKVCVLEKNQQIGGALQTYSRDKTIFDSGVHYLGGLEEGQNLYQIFKYVGILDQLRLVRMDEAVFDQILIEGDDTTYVFAQGYERFIRGLAASFPKEEAGIRAYVDKVRDVCSRFPLYNLRAGGVYQEKADVLGIDAKTCIDSFTSNPVLREVLAGNNLLYAGQPDKTPFYVHALILNSFIESAWKCVDGGSQIARALTKVIRAAGGVVRTRMEVTAIAEKRPDADPAGGYVAVTGGEAAQVATGDSVTGGEAAQATAGDADHVVLSDGSVVYGRWFISNLHPVKTMSLTDSSLIRPAYRNRLGRLENSVSSFCVNIVLKPGVVSYVKHNCYYHRKGRAWTMADYTPSEWPLGYALFYTPSREDPRFAESITLMTYMRYEEVLPWADTFNTVSAESDRGEAYAAFKEARYKRLLACVSEKFPWIEGAVASWYAATPLSLRDYLGTGDGSLYGIVKDYRDPVKTIIPARTKIPNLFLTGQNLNLHGILGSAISSLATCADLMGRDDFVEKIREA